MQLDLIAKRTVQIKRSDLTRISGSINAYFLSIGLYFGDYRIYLLHTFFLTVRFRRACQVKTYRKEKCIRLRLFFKC